MKKFWALLSLISAIFIFVSCIEEDDPEDNFSSDTAPAETGDTTPANPADTTPTDPADTGDTDTAPADTTPADPTDTTPADTADTGDTDYTPAPTCSCAGKDCGDDGCGNPCGDYNGGCQPNFTCLANNTCQCTPSCEGKLCTDDNGCGYPCGCKSNETCDTETGACECVPSCKGKECGDDGCGGRCGECGDYGMCIETSYVCKYCTRVELAEISDLVKGSSNRYYKTIKNAYTPNTGNSKDDKYSLSFTTQTEIKIGEDIDLSKFDSLNNCEDGQAKKALCFIIGQDHDGKGSNSEKVFFTQAGTLTINEYSGDHIKFTLKGVKLSEMEEYVVSGFPAHTERSFVPGGDCIIVNDTTLEK